MKKLGVAVFSVLAVSLLSSNSFAVNLSNATGVSVGGSAVKVHCHCLRCRPPYFDKCHHYRLCHYPYPNWYIRGADCHCSLLWPF